jgi:hypothetical protein
VPVSGGRGETLSWRALNRALLARQLLLRREPRSTGDVVEHLAGLQSQVPNPPYFALWARIHGFDPADLATLLTERPPSARRPCAAPSTCSRLPTTGGSGACSSRC